MRHRMLCVKTITVNHLRRSSFDIAEQGDLFAWKVHAVRTAGTYPS